MQIRTWAMHQTAEYGVAAHWKYKQGLANKQLGTEHDFEWVRKLLESQQDTDPDEFVRTLKVDMFADEVFVFTPNGDVKSLPAGATPHRLRLLGPLRGGQPDGGGQGQWPDGPL